MKVICTRADNCPAKSSSYFCPHMVEHEPIYLPCTIQGQVGIQYIPCNMITTNCLIGGIQTCKEVCCEGNQGPHTATTELSIQPIHSTSGAAG
jgi:hypothetical protein